MLRFFGFVFGWLVWFGSYLEYFYKKKELNMEIVQNALGPGSLPPLSFAKQDAGHTSKLLCMNVVTVTLHSTC